MNNYYLKYSNGDSPNAGSKARNDIDKIFCQMDFIPINLKAKNNGKEYNRLQNMLFRFYYLKNMMILLSKVKKGDRIFIQHPIQGILEFSWCINYLKKNNVKIISIVHDLEIFRNWGVNFNKKRAELNDLKVLPKSDIIILHNIKMIEKYVKKTDISSNKIIDLEIFDYLVNSNNAYARLNEDAIIVAGNLTKEKSGYVHKLHEIDCDFNLYGASYTTEKNYNNINYKGSFHPDELVSSMNGKFGLVWDGDSIDSCTGNTGDYLKINNPHKTSLYLSSGVPVIIWSKAALSEFVKKNNVGICVSDLHEIPEKLKKLTDEEYKIMQENCKIISVKLRSGYYSEKAIKQAIKKTSQNFK